MTTPMTTEGYAPLTALEVGLRAVFERDSAPNDALLSLFNVQTSERAVERNLRLGEFGLVGKYDGAIEYDSVDLGARADYIHASYSKGFAVERALVDDAEYGLLNGLTTRLARAFQRTVLTHAASVFNNAFNVSVRGSDGQPLCSGTGRNANGADTRNLGSSALSHDAVVATRQAMMRFKDERGAPLLTAPDTLVVPVELYDAALVITQSGLKPGGTTNDVNVNTGLRVVTSPFLTDVNNWFLVDSGLARTYLNWYWRTRPEFVLDPASAYQLKLQYRGFMRFSYGWDDHLWVYGHQVTG